MSDRPKGSFSVAGPNARREDCRFLFLKAAVAIVIPLVLGSNALAQRVDPRLPAAPPADKIFHKALQATLWVGASRHDDSGQQLMLRTGTILDSKNRLALTMASAVATEGFKIEVIGPEFDGGMLDNDSNHYKKRLDEGAGITARVVASDPLKDLAIIQLESLPSNARSMPLARAASKPGQAVMAVCASFSTREMWMRAPGVVLRVHPRKWQTAAPLDRTPLELQALVQECQFLPWPTQPGGPLVNERGEFIGMYVGSAAQTAHVAIDASEVRTLLRHPDVVAIVGGGGSRKAPVETSKERDKAPREISALRNRLRPTPKQTAVLRLVGRPYGVAAEYLNQHEIEDDVQRNATNRLRFELFTKMLTELEQRGMQHVGEVAARSADPLQARFIDVKVSGSLNVLKIHESLGPEESLEQGTFPLRAQGDRLPTAKPMSWYKYGWLRFGVADEVVGVVRVDCEPTDSNTADDDRAISPAEEKPRTWTAGSHTTEPTLISVDGPNVTLQKTNGNKVTIRHDLLSDEDQEYIRNSPLGRSK